LKQNHRRRVANGVRRNVTTAQRRTVRLSGLDVQLKPLLNSGPSHRPSEAIGQQRLIWFKTGMLQPSTDVSSGFLPEGNRALLSAFAQQLHGTVIVSLHVLHPDGESFGPLFDFDSGRCRDSWTAAPGNVHPSFGNLFIVFSKSSIDSCRIRLCLPNSEGIWTRYS